MLIKTRLIDNTAVGSFSNRVLSSISEHGVFAFSAAVSHRYERLMHIYKVQEEAAKRTISRLYFQSL